MGLLVLASHTRAVWFQLAVTMRHPSALHWAALSTSWCSIGVAVGTECRATDQALMSELNWPDASPIERFTGIIRKRHKAPGHRLRSRRCDHQG